MLNIHELLELFRIEAEWTSSSGPIFLGSMFLNMLKLCLPGPTILRVTKIQHDRLQLVFKKTLPHILVLGSPVLPCCMHFRLFHLYHQRGSSERFLTENNIQSAGTNISEHVKRAAIGTFCQPLHQDLCFLANHTGIISYRLIVKHGQEKLSMYFP